MLPDFVPNIAFKLSWASEVIMPLKTLYKVALVNSVAKPVVVLVPTPSKFAISYAACFSALEASLSVPDKSLAVGKTPVVVNPA